ncbi:spondin domain-containing protein [Deferrisoma palaeochoriense]
MRRGLVGAVAILGWFAGGAVAAEVTVEVTNATHGVYFTPLLVTAHGADEFLFEVGQPASGSLRAMAEGGDLTGLLADLGGADADTVADPAGGLLGPGETATARLDTGAGGHGFLSIVAMALPTNDGFVGLDRWPIPAEPGEYRLTLNLYDAGTEANDERITGGGAPGEPGIPADPGEHAGEGATGAAGADANPTVHVHRGTLGDTDPDGGPSDLDPAVHRWLNPVAAVRITVR